jgi:threonylcarbamoyladenosine tRNA methylthiotransferase MtaB
MHFLPFVKHSSLSFYYTAFITLYIEKRNKYTQKELLFLNTLLRIVARIMTQDTLPPELDPSNQVITFGCRLNTYETEVIKQKLAEAGASDTVVFNTCAVTSEAERQAQQAIRRMRRQFPDKKIVVTGCAAQVNPQKYAEMPEVSMVLGNQEKLEAHHYQPSLALTEHRVHITDIMQLKETAGHLVSSFEGKARAFMEIQNGCNHRCTFCIIPFGRGNNRSVPMGEIVNQARLLVEAGYPELVLTGVDITDYGKDLPGAPSLGQMVRRLLALVPDLRHLRLSSIDVAEIDDELRRLIAEEPRLMPHLHISVQAGDTMILKRMKRRHTRDDILAFTQWVRQVRPDIAFGADLIAGFPTETEEMFENSLRLIEEVGFVYLHVFPYSARSGTPAARMPQLPLATRKARAALLRQAGQKQLAAFLQTQVGLTLPALVEQPFLARTQNYAPVKLTTPQTPGDIIHVTITGCSDEQLLGEHTAPDA